MISMNPENVADLRATRERIALEVTKTEDHEAAKALYEARYLPASLALMDAIGSRVDVLIATVGTQPYSVAHSLRYSPADCVYLLCTQKSVESADRALALAQVSPRRLFKPSVRLDDQIEVYRAIREAIEANPGARLRVDFTSGTKAMSAAASTAAGYMGLEQVYISSKPIHRPAELSGHEHPQALDHPLEVFGDVKRQEAERAFDQRKFSLAETLFVELQRAQIPDYHLGARVGLCQGYAAWEGLAFADAAAHLEAAAKALDGALDRNISREVLGPAVPRLKAQAAAAALLAEATAGRNAAAYRDAAQTNALVRYLLARARRNRRAAPDLAALLVYRALELCLQRRVFSYGLDVARFSPDEPELLLEGYNRRCEPQHKLTAWPAKLALAQAFTLLQSLDDPALVGAGFDTGPGAQKLLGQVQSRNYSLYAHGFRVLAEGDFQRFMAVVEPLAEHTARADGLDLPTETDGDEVFDLIEFSALAP